MQTQLTTTNSGGTQTTTQSPQSAGQGDLSVAPTSNIQANSPLSLFNSQGGISLNPTPLSTVNLNTSATAVNNNPPATPKHHFNSGLLGISVFLFVIAMVMFWQTLKSANNTTD